MPRIPPCVTGTRKGAANPLLIIGATITVGRGWLNSGSETITLGREFLISLPTVGLKSDAPDLAALHHSSSTSPALANSPISKRR